MKPHLVILAAAGTGKTWQLSGRFLGLLLDGVPPERCLATTFTRKAAGEIQDRVLERLVDAIESARKRKELSEQIGRELSPAELRRALAQLVRHLDRFRVRTLDAFFLHLTQLFSLDLGLPPEWRIAEDPLDLRLRREAVQRALAQAPSDERLELLRSLSRADAARSVESVLLTAIDVGRDAFLDSDEAAWRAVRVPPRLGEGELAAAREAFAGVPFSSSVTKKPDARWTKSRDESLAALDAGDWESFLRTGLPNKVLAGEDSYYSRPIGAEVRAALAPLLREAAGALLAEIERQNLATRRWLARFESAYEAVKREERAYRFDDLPKRLNPEGRDPLAERGLEPWSRLDARIEHLLLDEFQDTAPVQWRCLARLAEPLLADDSGKRTFFCVGDVKQSIYGWREAEPRLLAELAKQPGLEKQQLTKSWRSSRVILETVDRVFSRLLDASVFSDKPAWRAAAAEWVHEHAPHTAALDLRGAAALYQTPESDDSFSLQPALVLAADRVRALVDASPGATVGVLLRRNEPIARMIYCLRDRGLRASGEGGNELTDSEAVLHVLSLLHLSDHPSDRAALHHVASSPLAAAVDVTLEARVLAADLRREIAVLGMGRFCARLFERTRPSYGDWDQKRFAQLVDLAYAWEDAAGLRADPFVDHVRATRVEDPSATQIQVMTIHAAKGLEFDAVVLPELGADFLQGRKRALLTRRPTPVARLDAVSVRPSGAVRRLDPQGLMALDEDQARRDVREALCLLYVAMTRAKHCLEMIVPPKCRPGPGQVLRELLGGGMPDAQGRLWVHEESTAEWHERVEAPVAAPEPAPAMVFAQVRRPRIAARRTPSAAEGAGRLDARVLLRSPAAAARVRGLLMHRWLESIEWLEDFSAGDEDLEALARPVTGDVALVRKTTAELRTALGRPGLRGVLERGAAVGGVAKEVWRERAFARVLAGGEGGEELWSGAIDRVIVEREGGRVVRARVLDFKTDRVKATEVEERLEFYRPQLLAYRRVLADVVGIAEERVTAAAVFLELDEVRVV